MLRSPLVWLGCADPAASIAAGRESDPRLADLREIVSLWALHLGVGASFAFTALDLVNQAARRDDASHDGYGSAQFKFPEFRDALLRVAGDKGVISTKRLRKWLAYNSGSVVCGLRIVEGAKQSHGSVANWSVVRIGDG